MTDTDKLEPATQATIAAAEERGRVAGLMLAEEIVERAAEEYERIAALAAPTDKQSEREFKMVASYLRNRVAEIHAAIIGPRLTPPDDAPAAQRNIDAKETER